jgi:phosphate transport system substrate-binding protein
VAPDDANFKAAAASADWNRSFYQVLTDLPGKDAWPLTGATYILIPRSPEKPEAAAAALKFFDWAYASGDAIATELKYVVLPDSLKTLVRKQWSGVQGKDGKALAFK